MNAYFNKSIIIKIIIYINNYILVHNKWIVLVVHQIHNLLMDNVNANKVNFIIIYNVINVILIVSVVQVNIIILLKYFR